MKKILVSLIVMTMALSIVMATECPAGTKPFFVETINVDASQSTAVSTSTLDSGVPYLLEASGTANAGDTIDFDAKYSITNRIEGDPWTDDVSGYTSYGTTLLDLFVDGGSVDWGAYNDEHTYSWALTGTGVPVDLLIYDIYYPNNVGSLAVDVFRCSDVKVNGGGHILEILDANSKRKDWLDISFGGFIADAGSAGLFGEWQINFHNVGDDDLDKSTFHTTDIVYLNLFEGNSNTCTEAMNFRANGELNGVPGYSIIFRAGDSSEPASSPLPNDDTVRVTLYNSGNQVIYDTHAGDFTDESSCVGTARTGLDTGNIIING